MLEVRSVEDNLINVQSHWCKGETIARSNNDNERKPSSWGAQAQTTQCNSKRASWCETEEDWRSILLVCLVGLYYTFFCICYGVLVAHGLPPMVRFVLLVHEIIWSHVGTMNKPKSLEYLWCPCTCRCWNLFTFLWLVGLVLYIAHEDFPMGRYILLVCMMVCALVALMNWSTCLAHIRGHAHISLVFLLFSCVSSSYHGFPLVKHSILHRKWTLSLTMNGNRTTKAFQVHVPRYGWAHNGPIASL